MLLSDEAETNLLKEKRTLLNDAANHEESMPLTTSEAEKVIMSVHPHDVKGVLEWSWRESVCCDLSEGNPLSALAVCTMSPCILVAFSVTLLGKLLHDHYDQGLPLTTSETSWERKVRVQGVLTTTGLMIIMIGFSAIILLRRYFQLKTEGEFDDLATVYLRTLITIASSINVIFSNIIFLNAMRSKWQQTVNFFIIGAYAIVLAQITVGSFDTWILVSGDYSYSDIFFCVLHSSETLYSAVQCILYSGMWNYYDILDGEANKFAREQRPTTEGEIVASTNIVLLIFVNWASILISFRFTSISAYLQRQLQTT